jgi:hypothetical protein
MGSINAEKAIHIISKHDLSIIELPELMAIEKVVLNLFQLQGGFERTQLIQEFLAYMELRKSDSLKWNIFCMSQKSLNDGKHNIGKTGLNILPLFSNTTIIL